MSSRYDRNDGEVVVFLDVLLAEERRKERLREIWRAVEGVICRKVGTHHHHHHHHCVEKVEAEVAAAEAATVEG